MCWHGSGAVARRVAMGPQDEGERRLFTVASVKIALTWGGDTCRKHLAVGDKRMARAAFNIPITQRAAAMAAALAVTLAGAPNVQAQGLGTSYQQPGAAVREVLDTPSLPRYSVSPDRQTLATLELRRFASLEELARPVLRLAGLRFEPATSSPQNPTPLQRLHLRSLLNPDAPERNVDLPIGGVFHSFAWAPDGRRFILVRRTETASELWVGEVGRPSLQPVAFIKLNQVLMPEPVWIGPHELIVATVPDRRGAPPPAPRLPPGPAVQESLGKTAPERPLPGLLSDAHDEALFEFHARSTLTRVDIASGFSRDLGTPGLWTRVQALGEGHLLTERLTRPFSYAQAWDGFPRSVELRQRDGRLLRELARLPLKSSVGAEVNGPRAFTASPFDGALFWAETSNGRDRLVRLDPPYSGEPQELLRLANRFARLAFLDDGQQALLTESDRSRGWVRALLLPLRGGPARLLFEHASRERYHHPGTPLEHQLANGRSVLITDHGDLLMAGPGATPRGERPFLDRLSLKDGSSARVFQSGEAVYEQVLTPLDGDRLLTQRESPTEPPNLFLRDGTGLSALTRSKDPSPQLRRLRRELVSFKRADGVDMSFQLVLPPDFKEGEHRPALIWAYPQDYNDRATASQTSGTDNRFSQPAGLSPLLLALEGYAVLMDASMPIIGDPRNGFDSAAEQLLMDVHAIVDKAEELGSVDVHRLAIGGHSYGASMTASVLAATDLFRCGIARSGAYNRTLTPFGFQNERRSFWDARDSYLRASPLLLVDHIKEPLLLIHGEADDNPGTAPMQSERLFQALAGTGGTARYVPLPLESHNYVARESVGHVQWEMSRWLHQCLGDPRVPGAAASK